MTNSARVSKSSAAPIASAFLLIIGLSYCNDQALAPPVTSPYQPDPNRAMYVDGEYTPWPTTARLLNDTLVVIGEYRSGGGTGNGWGAIGGTSHIELKVANYQAARDTFEIGYSLSRPYKALACYKVDFGPTYTVSGTGKYTGRLVIQEVDTVQRKIQGTFQFTATGLVCLVIYPYDCKYEDVHESGRFTAIYDTSGNVPDYLH